MSKPLKILVIRLSSIGDIVLTTPVVRCLKKQLNAEVHFLTKAPFECILANNPYVDKIHFLKDGEAPLQFEKFDWVIDLHHNLRTKKVKNALGVPAKSFHKLNIEKWLLTTFKINRLPEKHIVDRYLETVEHLGVKKDGGGLDYFLTDADGVSTAEYEMAEKKGYVAVVIGGQHATKILPTEKLIAVCEKVNKPILLIGGKEDVERGEIIASAVSNTYNMCGKFSINQSAYLIQQAESVITHDTGMMHIAAAFHKKIYSVWGNTVPEFGMYPYLADSASKMIEVKGLSCRPCSKIGYKKCPKGHFKCMNDIDVNLFAQE
jgi:ADP-heptose:LPS heptosyltransferase